MFSKKNKGAPLPDIAGPGSSHRQSLFAPDLNPPPAHVDLFGPSPAPAAPWPQEPPAAAPMDFQAEALPAWPEPAEQSQPAWPQEPSSMPESSAPWPEQPPVDWPEATEPPVESFEAGATGAEPWPSVSEAVQPEPAWPPEPMLDESSAVTGMETAWPPVDAAEPPMPPELEMAPQPEWPTVAQGEPGDWPSALPAEPPQPGAMPNSFDGPVPEESEPVLAATSEGLWDQLASPETAAPGEQVPLDPGAFLDSVNEQLYPDDPLTAMDPMSVNAGEQAFEEAAQFLFPETATAPLEWGEEIAPSSSGDRVAGPESPALSDDLFEPPILELGPSIQMEQPGGFADISSVPLETPDLVQFEPPMPAAAGEGDTDFNPEHVWFAEEEETVSPALGPDEAAWASSSPQLEPDLLGPGLQPPDWSASEEATVAPEALLGGTLSEDVQESGEYPSPDTYLEDADFYAPSYALDEQGEIVPDYGQYTPEQAPMPSAQTEAMEPAWQDWPLTEPQADLSPRREEASSLESLAPPGDEEAAWTGAEPSPAYALEPPLEPAPATPAEELPSDWLSPPLDTSDVVSSTAQTMDWAEPDAGQEAEPQVPQEPPATLSMENLEILGVCPLDADKRLLMVQSDGAFALMGQSGLEEPQVSVLKIFDHNPVAYQNTFTAVREGQAGEQGMYVVQLGTWHAVVSTFQNSIMIHTELG